MPKTKTFIPVDRWGKDHWSLVAYLECRAVDHKGEIDKERMRCDADLHPGLVGMRCAPPFSKLKKVKFPTILKDGKQLRNHDDWSCAYDLERAGLIELRGTGINPIVVFTEKGFEIAAVLRKHKAKGKNFASFTWEERDGSQT